MLTERTDAPTMDPTQALLENQVAARPPLPAQGSGTGMSRTLYDCPRISRRITTTLFATQSLARAAFIACGTVSALVVIQLSGDAAWAGVPAAVLQLAGAFAALVVGATTERVAKYIKTGQVYNEIDDQDLFMFAFNKSNFRSSKYDFISYTNGGLVEIERSSIKDKVLLKGFLEAVEKKLKPINESIKVIYQKHSI